MVEKEKEFKTLEDWKAYLKRDKTEDIEAWKERVGIVSAPIQQTMHVNTIEGELR